jgi:hypothetical protein
MLLGILKVLRKHSVSLQDIAIQLIHSRCFLVSKAKHSHGVQGAAHNEKQFPEIRIHKYCAVSMEDSQICELLQHDSTSQCILQPEHTKKGDVLASHPAFRRLDESKVDPIFMLATVGFKHGLWAVPDGTVYPKSESLLNCGSLV